MGTEAYETKTKIVATLGPASWAPEQIARLIEAGVDTFRINCSHAQHDSIRMQVTRVREASKAAGQPIAVLLDLQGPKVRTGVADPPLQLPTGGTLTVVMDEALEASGQRIGTTYPEMAGDVDVGTEVLFADGELSGVVQAVRRDIEPAEVDIHMTFGGELGSRKGINLPGVELSIPALTEKDVADLEVGLEAGADYVALSFVQRPEDVMRLEREMLRCGRRVPIIAKIEKPTAVERIDEIAAVCEGLMVARGDLGVEATLERVPVLQKRIIQAGFEAHRIVITATQMLDSMTRNPRPTRAETTDVANAILDGTDAVMLSGETSIGDHPVRAVKVMDQISREVESSRFFCPTTREGFPGEHLSSTEVLLRSACFAARQRLRPLVIFSWTGSSAVYVSKARNTTPIYALTADPRVLNRLQLVWGVTPLLIAPAQGIDELIAAAEKALLATGQVERGEEVVMVIGNARSRARNLMKIHTLGEA